MSITNPEFQSHGLNEFGIKKVEAVKRLFDELLNKLCSASREDSGFLRMLDEELERRGWKTVPLIPPGRYLSIVKTKLEEACMFAVKAVSCDPANQTHEGRPPLPHEFYTQEAQREPKHKHVTRATSFRKLFDDCEKEPELVRELLACKKCKLGVGSSLPYFREVLTVLLAKQNKDNLPRIPDTVTINGAKIIGPALIDILNMVTQPNPRRWYRFERQDDLVLVHTKQDEESK